MSVFGSMTTAVAGLAAQARSLGNLSDNIANSQTVGYKRVETSFQSLVTQSNADLHSPGGVRARPSYTNSIQGTISQTENNTNMAISGNGFFQVSRGTEATNGVDFQATQFYTRAGDFKLDRFGYLQNSAGMYLNGWGLDGSGSLDKGTIAPIRIQQLIDTPTATQNINLSAGLPMTPTKANLPAQKITVIDSTGVEHDVSLNWRRQGNGDWRLNIDASPDSVSPTSGSLPSTLNPLTAIGPATTTLTGQDPQVHITNVAIGAVTSGTVYTMTVNNQVFRYTATSADVLSPNNVTLELFNQISAANPVPGGTITYAPGTITINGDSLGKKVEITSSPAALTATELQPNIEAKYEQITVPIIGPAGGVGDVYTVDWGGAPTINYTTTGEEANAKELAEAIAAQINSNPTSPVQASANGGNLKLVAKTPTAFATYVPTVSATAGSLTPYVHLTFNGGFLSAMDTANVGPTGNAMVPPTQNAGDPAYIEFTLNFGNGPQKVKLNMGEFGTSSNLTQFVGSDLVTNSITQDGFTRGAFQNLEIKSSGDVVANYDNGRSRVLSRVPVIQVTNPDAMQKVNGNAFQMTREAGGTRADDSGTNGAGGFAVSSVEGSNVDIAQEFTKMIVTQRAYSANTKVVSASDEMLQETLGMKR